MAGRLIRIEDPADARIAEFTAMRDRDLAGRGDRFIAEGRVVLQALLDAEAGDRRFVIEKALILENRVEGLEDLLARIDSDCPVYVAGREVLDAAVGFAMHRGILAVGRHVPATSLPEFLSHMPDRALLVVACGTANHDNIGGIFRNAGVFGADGVVLDATCCDPLYRKAIRVSVGAALRVPFCRGGSITELVSALASAGFEVAGLSPQGAEPLAAFKPGRRLALLAGTEGEGLPAEILKSVKTLRIEQAPGMDSLNVATASGIALWHVAGRMGRTSGT
ncbi:MAG: RNA methyltransferase [Hoeflea sp.]|uniref:TrmH family RNA methyltransferase n=1 Tax=Hoeflea sp. TaxID=1940281 RepID=UPI001DF33D12|nr:RNA methyltransferase [Hoeflea sp.]MBU4530872.1 RNA methyltransferase [Alphaproteobacteria bacterium]MBU4542421.1 RNA methyltransferase [Alphaproteobacteria bacterium]MBU4552309.1 RNA methyltransferase [Alphaproteobacteria bacterium]MBV1723464.1 RNA methyltransferase [Hoeflea sp.]MBV1760234.1 RNA methyltransferase [Hoeflea sp.]